MATDVTAAQQLAGHIVPPEFNLTVDELHHRADALRPLLRERQAECEASGELPTDTNQRFLDAGFYRILQPRLFGGYEFALPDFIRVMIAVARGCSESAWDYASGCDLATHFFGSTMVRDPTTNASLGNAWILFDRDQFQVIDNWNVIGMQGTGSRRVVIDDAFVPTDRALWFLDGAGRPVRDQPGHALHPNPMYHAWLAPLLISEVAAVSVGAARGALDIYEEILSSKKTNFPPFHARSREAEFQQHFGEAQALIDTAEAALLKMTSDYMDLARSHVETGAPLDEEMERRLILIEQQVIRLAWDAVELMFRTSGTSAAAKTSPLGRALRNLAVIRTHVTLQLDHTATNAGRLHFGHPPLSRF